MEQKRYIFVYIYNYTCSLSLALLHKNNSIPNLCVRPLGSFELLTIKVVYCSGKNIKRLMFLEARGEDNSAYKNNIEIGDSG